MLLCNIHTCFIVRSRIVLLLEHSLYTAGWNILYIRQFPVLTMTILSKIVLSFSELYINNFIFCCCRENCQMLLRTRVFSCVYFHCVGIMILKIVLLHAHKWVTSDFILQKYIFLRSCALLRIQAWRRVNITLYAMRHDDSRVVNFWRENKYSANWCAKQSRESLTNSSSNTF